VNTHPTPPGGQLNLDCDGPAVAQLIPYPPPVTSL